MLYFQPVDLGHGKVITSLFSMGVIIYPCLTLDAGLIYLCEYKEPL